MTKEMEKFIEDLKKAIDAAEAFMGVLVEIDFDEFPLAPRFSDLDRESLLITIAWWKGFIAART